ncbi:MAG: TerB family tellurite resistance protein [Cytophagales bacterium]|nr:MAG: TerB family tellurite resistance protein [Cytophagales bacterium]
MTKTTISTVLFQQAKAQEQPISIGEVKALVQKLMPEYYPKILIDDNTPLMRSHYFYSRYLGKEIIRKTKHLQFPKYGSVIDTFATYENSNKKKAKIAIESSTIFEEVARYYQLQPQDMPLPAEPAIESPFDFPLAYQPEQGLAPEQSSYFFPVLVKTVKDIAHFKTAEVEGDFYSLTFVATEVAPHAFEGLSLKDGLEMEAEVVEKIRLFCDTKTPTMLQNVDFKKYDSTSKIQNTTDEYAIRLCNEIRAKLPNNPEIVEERLFYQVIPCIEISYRHVLANTVEKMTIINALAGEKAYIHLHSDPEGNRKNLQETAKSVGGFLSKIFQTKGYRSKEDRKNEINLMIRVAKVDGVIKDEEKLKLSEMIGGLDEFTHAERLRFFELMSQIDAPELKEQDLIFSSEEVAQEVFEHLEEIMNIDGKAHDKEKQLIDRVRQKVIIKKK